MPSRSADSVIKYSFRKGLPKYFAHMLCREAQSLTSPITARFEVYLHNNDQDQVCVEIKEIGKYKLKAHLEEILQITSFKKKELPRHALDFIAKKIDLEKHFNVKYFISKLEKYQSRIDVYGEDREIFLNAVNHYIEEYVFDIPLVLSLIIIERMKCKLPRENLEVVCCGLKSIVYPTGENADIFYDEFLKLFNAYEYKVVEFPESEYPGITHECLIEACRVITKDIRDVHHFVKGLTVILKGFETVDIFAATIPLKLKISKKESVTAEKTSSPKVKICSSPIEDVLSEEELEIFQEEVSFGN